MKYRILVQKSDNQYTASCVGLKRFAGSGDTFSSAMNDLQSKLFCYLHDPQAEFEIIIKPIVNSSIAASKERLMESVNALSAIIHKTLGSPK